MKTKGVDQILDNPCVEVQAFSMYIIQIQFTVYMYSR